MNIKEKVNLFKVHVHIYEIITTKSLHIIIVCSFKIIKSKAFPLCSQFHFSLCLHLSSISTYMLSPRKQEHKTNPKSLDESTSAYYKEDQYNLAVASSVQTI
jgi:hypothetical protein